MGRSALSDLAPSRANILNVLSHWPTDLARLTLTGSSAWGLQMRYWRFPHAQERASDGGAFLKAIDGPQQISEPTDVIPGNSSTTFTLAVGGSETGVVNSVGD